MQIQKVVPWVSATVGSYAGWFLGAKAGIFVAFILSIIGGGAGLYLGRRWVIENL